MDALSAAGVPVYAVPGRGGGIALLEHCVLERAALFRQRAPNWLQVDLSQWGCPDRGTFQRLCGAILERRVIAFRYVSSAGRSAPRRVLPARLVFQSRAWYLQGFCLLREDYRTFKVSRMLDLAVSEERFDRPLAPPPVQDPGAKPPFSVSLVHSFAPWMAHRVYDELDPDCIAPQDDGSPSPHYCKYCYQKGAFTGEMTMEEIIDFCTPILIREHPELSEEQARAQMHQFFPLLLRWRNP